ncbi:MAG: radical SAM protein [Planctomycetota bacterium]|nr:radical SAM protein [Planctomycetota bacterium]
MSSERSLDPFRPGVSASNLILRAALSSRPLGASWELTHRCPLACRHCYLIGAAVSGEMSREEAFRALDVLARAGVLFLVFTGGEPTCHPAFRDIASRAKRTGFCIQVYTGGANLEESDWDFFAGLSPLNVEITIHSPEPETHDSVTGRPGSFERAVRSLGEMRRRGVRTVLKVTVSSLNVGSLERMRMLASDLGAALRVGAEIVPAAGPMRMTAPDLAVTPAALAAYYRSVAARSGNADLPAVGCGSPDREGAGVSDGSGGPENCRAPGGGDVSRGRERDAGAASGAEAGGIRPPADAMPCGAGRSSLALDPLGTVYPCVTWREPLGNLLREPFGAIWNGEAARRVRAVRFGDSAECMACEALPFCRRCPGESWLRWRDPRRPAEYNCARGRAALEASRTAVAAGSECVASPSGAADTAAARIPSPGRTQRSAGGAWEAGDRAGGGRFAIRIAADDRRVIGLLRGCRVPAAPDNGGTEVMLARGDMPASAAQPGPGREIVSMPGLAAVADAAARRLTVWGGDVSAADPRAAAVLRRMLCVACGGLPLHASAVASVRCADPRPGAAGPRPPSGGEAAAFVFCAGSEGGKSTCANLLATPGPAARLMCDETCLLFPSDLVAPLAEDAAADPSLAGSSAPAKDSAGAALSGTFFAMSEIWKDLDIGRNESLLLPAAAILFLEKGEETRLEEMSGHECVRQLMACSLAAWRGRDLRGCQLEVCAAVAERVRCARLIFRPSAEEVAAALGLDASPDCPGGVRP